MAEIHSIRLHGPWQASVLECVTPEADFELRRRIKIPSDWSDWLGESFRGRVAYVRNFGLPTGLEADQIVWLVVEAVDFCGSVFLNGQSLGDLQLGDPPMRIEAQSHLRKSNELRIEIALPMQSERGDRNELAGGLIGGVRLEIEESI